MRLPEAQQTKTYDLNYLEINSLSYSSGAIRMALI